MILLHIACDFLSAVFLGGDIISGRRMNFNQTKIEIEKSLCDKFHSIIIHDVETLTLEKR